MSAGAAGKARGGGTSGPGRRPRNRGRGAGPDA